MTPEESRRTGCLFCCFLGLHDSKDSKGPSGLWSLDVFGPVNVFQEAPLFGASMTSSPLFGASAIV